MRQWSAQIIYLSSVLATVRHSSQKRYSDLENKQQLINPIFTYPKFFFLFANNIYTSPSRRIQNFNSYEALFSFSSKSIAEVPLSLGLLFILLLEIHPTILVQCPEVSMLSCPVFPSSVPELSWLNLPRNQTEMLLLSQPFLSFVL